MGVNRRRAVAGGAALLVLPVLADRHGELDARALRKLRRMRPQPGDVLVHAFGALAGAPVAAEDVADEPLSAFGQEPASGLVRDGSLHGQVLVVRVAAPSLSAPAERYALVTGDEAFLVYSAACTHTGCEVNGWQADSRRLVCPCHGSEFDVADAARVAVGPAPKPLAMLAVEFAEADDGRRRFRVAGAFSRRVGPAPP